ncbi:hypothetical protein Pmani_030256 [Petrolisthes manimaculis]|uniref:Uncharacterized protein n=1 Tax=Petrolisthes manimaculis TaxID=1843537 RepID=A0AAE1NXT5_9EUCA|nr:hypothetical protein Pmani_030256 [Petrolisthes manimaculis]
MREREEEGRKRGGREHERKRLFTMLLFYPGRVPAEGGGAGYWKEGEQGRKEYGQMEEEKEGRRGEGRKREGYRRRRREGRRPDGGGKGGGKKR